MRLPNSPLSVLSPLCSHVQLLEGDERFDKVPDAAQRERLWAKHVERLTGRAPRSSAPERDNRRAGRGRCAPRLRFVAGMRVSALCRS